MLARAAPGWLIVLAVAGALGAMAAVFVLSRLALARVAAAVQARRPRLALGALAAAVIAVFGAQAAMPGFASGVAFADPASGGYLRQARFVLAMVGPGRVAPALGDSPDLHRLFADHLTAEYRVKTKGRGRTVDEWKIRPERSDNHWFDCLVGCAVAASMQGVSLAETKDKPVECRKRIKPGAAAPDGGNQQLYRQPRWCQHPGRAYRPCF